VAEVTGTEATAEETATAEEAATTQTPAFGDRQSLEQQVKDLKALVATGLATPKDSELLQQLEAQVTALPATSQPTESPASQSDQPVNPLAAQQVQRAANARLTDVERQVSTLQTEYSNLQKLSDLSLAEGDETTKLQTVTSQLKALDSDRSRLQRQVNGKYPWYIDTSFVSPYRNEELFQSANVTLVTDVHPAADTQNFVYLDTGARKYLLGSPEVPLAGGSGPQTFTLYLDSGLLTKEDLRKWALGMLGSPLPYAQAPDRWHATRVVVEIDGQVAYDSEENDGDRRSLNAVRLIPPAHYDQSGKLVINTPVAREVFVWEAGKNEGIDVATGDPLDLPDTNSDQYPKQEPGTFDLAEDESEDVGGADFPGEQQPLDDQDALGLGDGSGLGSYGSTGGACGGFGASGDYGAGWGASGGGGLDDFGGSGWGDLSGMGSGWGSGLGGTGGFGGLGDTGGLGGVGGLGGLGAGSGGWVPLPMPTVPPTKDPPATGDPFQIESVRLTSGWKSTDSFTIEWKVKGSEAEIANYDVALRIVRPDTDQVLFAHLLRTQLPAGSRTYTGNLDQAITVSQPYFFVAPVVTAIPKDSSKTPHERIGPARTIFSGASLNAFVPLQLDNLFTITRTVSGSPTITSAPVSFAGEPTTTGAAVWESRGVEESHNAILFDNPKPAMTIAARATKADNDLSFSLSQSSLASGTYELVGFLGYLGGAGAKNTVQLQVNTRITSIGNTSAKPLELKQQVVLSSGGSTPSPMQLVQQTIDTSGISGGKEPYQLNVTFRLVSEGVDPVHPPAIFGLRLLPQLMMKFQAASGSFQTFSNPHYPDLVCSVEVGTYSHVDNVAGSIYDTEGVHFMDLGRVKVTVRNQGGQPSGPCKVGILSSGSQATAGGSTQLAKVGKPKPPGMIELPGVEASKLQQLSGGGSPQIDWLATTDVPPLVAGEKTEIYLALPTTLVQPLVDKLSQSKFRAMVDMDNSVTVDEGPDETNNWSNTFYLSEGPYISNFVTKDSELVTDQRVQIYGRVYGSSSWAIDYEYLGANLMSQKHDSDPEQKKPFPKLSSGKYISLPWVPWSINQPQTLDAKKVKVILTVFNSNKSRSAKAEAVVQLNDFYGTFQIIESKTAYDEVQGRAAGYLKIKANCNKPFSVGDYGNFGYGSMYVLCEVLNPDEVVWLWSDPPNSTGVNAYHDECIGKSVYKKVHSVYADAPKRKSSEAGAASIIPSGQLPAQGEFSIIWEMPLTTKLQSIALPTLGTKYKTFRPALRSELFIHTGRDRISLKATQPVDAPIGMVWSKKLRNVVEPVDHSMFVDSTDWKW
jgi:hypothetical protein